MKTEFKTIRRPRKSRLAPPHLRLTTARLGRSRGTKSAGADTLIAPAPAALSVPAAPAEPVAADLPRADTLQLYLREIGQVKLLTPQEEIVLARRIKKGDRKAREHMIRSEEHTSELQS